jgi:hypothetical protein
MGCLGSGVAGGLFLANLSWAMSCRSGSRKARATALPTASACPVVTRLRVIGEVVLTVVGPPPGLMIVKGGRIIDRWLEVMVAPHRTGDL